MIKLIHYIITHFSGYALGWHQKSFNELGGTNWNSDIWTGISTVIMGVCGVIIIANIIQTFFANPSKKELKFFIPLVFFYIIQNIIFNLFLSCLFFTIGGLVGFFILGCIYLFIIMFNGIAGIVYEGYADGIFKLFKFIVQYSQDVTKYYEEKNRIQKKYNHFLNIEY